MTKYFKYLALICLCLSSFYYTHKVALYVKEENPYYQNINNIKDSKTVSYIDSIIDNDYIIPGLSGKEVNINASLSNMQKYKTFNESLLVYNIIKPQISIEDNKDKIIIRGNQYKNKISIIFEEINHLSIYMSSLGYKTNLLLTEEKYDLSYEMINNSNNEITYHNIDKYLNKKKINKNLCYIKNNLKKLCLNKYLFKPSLIINHSNLSSNINKIQNGEIILIQKSLSLSELEILLNQINYQDLEIVPLSVLIKE